MALKGWREQNLLRSDLSELSFYCNPFDIGQDPGADVQRPQEWEMLLSLSIKCQERLARMSLPLRFLLWDATARLCELDGALPSKQALGCWNLTFQSWVLTPKVTSSEGKLDILTSV